MDTDLYIIGDNSPLVQLNFAIFSPMVYTLGFPDDLSPNATLWEPYAKTPTASFGRKKTHLSPLWYVVAQRNGPEPDDNRDLERSQ